MAGNTRVFSLKVPVEQHEEWKAAAERAGCSLNAWMRRAGNSQLRIQEAEHMEEENYQAIREAGRKVNLPGYDLAGGFRPDPKPGQRR